MDARLNSQENIRLVERPKVKELVVVKDGKAIEIVLYDSETDREKKQKELSGKYKN